MELKGEMLEKAVSVRLYPFKHYRKICIKNRQNFQVYLPVAWINGSGSAGERVSVQLGRMTNGHLCILIDLYERMNEEVKREHRPGNVCNFEANSGQ